MLIAIVLLLWPKGLFDKSLKTRLRIHAGLGQVECFLLIIGILNNLSH